MFRFMPMRVRRTAFRPLIAMSVVLSMCVPAISSAQVAADPDTLAYHQITDLGDDFVGVAAPELSADGQVAVFADAPGTGDTATPNRIMTLDAEGGPLTEVDSYQTLCYCSSLVDVNEDGSVVVSTDSVQVRVAEAGDARELLVLSSNELGPVRITASGDRIFFVIRRDTSTADGGDLIPRGVWRIDSDGENLTQIVSADDLAELEGVTVDQTGCCFYADGMPLDVSADGNAVVFGAGVSGTERVYGVNGDGGDLNQLADPFTWVKNVAISGDGTTVAYNAIPPDPSGHDEVGVLPFTGGEREILATNTGAGFDDLLRLSEDGSALLLAPLGYLIDTASGDIRQLAAVTPGADNQTSLLYDGLARAAMNTDADRVLYVMSFTRCADCPNQHEQLAVLDIGPAESGPAPVIVEASIDPDELTIGSDDRATATAEVAIDGELVAVGVVALRDGVYDLNVAYNAYLVDDGTLGDTRSNDDVYTNDTVSYSPVVARDDGDDGPRTMRFQAEIIGPDGLRHAIAVDAATLTVVAP